MSGWKPKHGLWLCFPLYFHDGGPGFKFIDEIGKKVNGYNQEMKQSHIADQPTTPWGRATEH